MRLGSKNMMEIMREKWDKIEIGSGLGMKLTKTTLESGSVVPFVKSALFDKFWLENGW